MNIIIKPYVLQEVFIPATKGKVFLYLYIITALKPLVTGIKITI